MKETLIKIVLCMIGIALILGMIALAEIFSSVITIDMIMPVAYIALGYSFIYLIRN